MAKSITGILKRRSRGDGFLRQFSNGLQPHTEDVRIAPAIIKEHQLVEGTLISGAIQSTSKGTQLVSIDTIFGLPPQQFKERIPFDRLLPVTPDERIPIGANGNPAMRILELFTPFGPGTRGLIVSPPKAGKTKLLEDLAAAIRFCQPQALVFALLIDERPEEVTHFKRNVPATVLASSSDKDIRSHVNLVELVLAYARTALECGQDIYLLVDSLTRLSRAFNLNGTGSRRTMTGGLDARALEIPRKFFGLARKIEHGGSITVIATVQVQTGSRMDDYIFEEFKSTGNCEIVLDRELAEARIFPALNLMASGTRREELLYSEDELSAIVRLRNLLLKRDAKTALRDVRQLINQYPDNAQLLKSILTTTT